MIWFAAFTIVALLILVTLSVRAESENNDAYSDAQAQVEYLDARYREIGF